MFIDRGLRIRNFRLSDWTMQQLKELAAHEHRKETEHYYGVAGKFPTTTDMIRTLVMRAHQAMKAEPPKTLAETLSKPEPTPKAKGKDRCKTTKPSSTPIAPVAPKSALKSKRSKKYSAA